MTRTEKTAGRQAGWNVTRERMTYVIRQSDTNVTMLTFHARSLFITSFLLLLDLKPCSATRQNGQHGCRHTPASNYLSKADLLRRHLK